LGVLCLGLLSVAVSQPLENGVLSKTERIVLRSFRGSQHGHRRSSMIDWIARWLQKAATGGKPAASQPARRTATFT